MSEDPAPARAGSADADRAIRYDLLKSVVARYDSYYNLAAVKASLLLTSNAIFLAPSLGEKSPWLSFAEAGGAARALVAASMLLSLVSMIGAAIVIASWLSNRGGSMRPDSLVFSESVARMSADDYAAQVDALTPDAAIDDLARLAHLMASNLTLKFVCINVSLAALVAAVVCACVATVA